MFLFSLSFCFLHFRTAPSPSFLFLPRILQMYNMVNKRLPGWQDPPSRKKIQEALHAFDSNKDGVLDPREVRICFFFFFLRRFARLKKTAFSPLSLLSLSPSFPGKNQFQQFAQNLVSTGPDAFFARIGKNVSNRNKRRAKGKRKK